MRCWSASVLALLLWGMCARADEGDVEVEDATPDDAAPKVDAPKDAADAPKDAADAPKDAAAGGEDLSDDEKAKAYEDSYGELQDKMGQLQSLLAAKGEGADPDLKERLAGLQKQLSGLGMGGIAPEPEPGSSPELTEFLTGCVMMSMRRAGMQRLSTIEAMKKVADDKMSPEQCSKNELWKMIGICISEFTDKDLENLKSGKYQTLPASYVAMAKEAKAETAVMELDTAIWKELRIIAATMVKQLGNPDAAEPAPLWIGMLGAIPFVLAIGFLAKKFLEMQNRNAEGTKKDKKREGKKSK